MNEMYIEEDKSILDAMEQIDRNTRKTLFVHKDGRLLASLTDGDIRRWILKKGDLHAAVRYAANYQPQYLYEAQADLAAATMREYGIGAMPIVDSGHRIKKVVFLDGEEQGHGTLEKGIPVVIMAGGMGTRLLPYTNILPKPLIPVGDYPIAEHIIRQFYSYGCTQFYMIVNYKRNMIKAYFDELDKPYQLEFVTEEKALGTGGGISLLRGKIDGTFILTNCDILIDEDLTKVYRQHMEAGNLITMVCSLKNFTIPYGVVKVGENGNIESMQEKPKMSFFTNTGCYFVEPEVIESQEEGKAIDFPAIVGRYLDSGRKIGIYPIHEERWLDMGQLDELEKMKARLGCG